MVFFSGFRLFFFSVESGMILVKFCFLDSMFRCGNRVFCFLILLILLIVRIIGYFRLVSFFRISLLVVVQDS